MNTKLLLSFAIASLSLIGLFTAGCVSPVEPNSMGPFTLSLVDSGSGTGAITSSGTATLDCKTNQFMNCSGNYAGGASVRLTAAASADSIFMGWSGGCTGITPTCDVTMSQALTVTAQFNAIQDKFQIVIAGSGAGAVKSAPAGLSCGNFTQVSPSQCSETVNQGSMVTLTETAQPNSRFVGWSGGGCSGTSKTCVVDVNLALTVTATFDAIEDSFQLIVAGNGAGVVTSAPTGISCGSGYAGAPTACSESIAQGTSITLTAKAQTNSQLVGWMGGGCMGTSITCVVDISQAQMVTAIFNVIEDSFNLTVVGSGAGTVTSAPAGLDCGANYAGAPTACQESVAQGGTVTLNALAQPGSSFSGWSGGVCMGNTTLSCAVNVGQAQTITATFTLVQLTSPLVSSIGLGATSQGQIQTLGINYYIANYGVFPSQGGGSANTTGDPYLGQVMPFASDFAPPGWLLCNGSLLNISTNTALFSIIGNTYGGNGTTNFALPDLRGRVPMGLGSDTAVPSSPGVSDVPLISSIAWGSTAQGQIDVVGLNYYIATLGVFPSQGGGGSANTSGPYVGQIMSFAGNFAPTGWALCDGSSIAISSNTALFSILGTNFGGNGTTDFNLPDLRVRLPLGVGALTDPVTPPTSSTQEPLITSIGWGANAQGQVNVLGIGYYITDLGIYPSNGGSGTSVNYLGEIQMFAGNFAPTGWLACNGALMNISTNTALFSLVGTTFGGNGTSTFGIPDLRARVPMGVGSN